MNNYELNISVEPKDKYEKAQKALLEADMAISKLTPAQQNQLSLEYANYKCICALAKMIFGLR